MAQHRGAGVMAEKLIVYPDAGPSTPALFHGNLTERLRRLGRFELHADTPADEQEFAARIADAEAVILGWGMPDPVLASAGALKIVAFTGIGASNHINLDLARDRGVLVCNTPGYADVTVAEHTLALMLAGARHIAALDASVKAGAWDHSHVGFDLRGKCLGIVGLGGIGTRVAHLAKAFGMEVIAWTANPSPDRAADAGLRFEPLETVFDRADIVSLHCALTPQTEGMITGAHLDRMKDGALLINTARGELVEEAALMAALTSGRISAGLDVFHREPLAEDHPLRRLPNVVLTPHSAYNTPEAGFAIHEMCVAAIEGFYDGRPINVVNP